MANARVLLKQGDCCEMSKFDRHKQYGAYAVFGCAAREIAAPLTPAESIIDGAIIITKLPATIPNLLAMKKLLKKQMKQCIPKPFRDRVYWIQKSRGDPSTGGFATLGWRYD